MAKGRKFGINRNNYEWFLGSYSNNNGHARGSNYRDDDSSELREQHVWSMIHNNGEDDNNYGNNITVRTHRRREERRVGGESMTAFRDSVRTAGSAPVNVPDWSKILRAESVESLPAMEDNNNDEAEMVPPHEYLARSRNAAAATSVFEGVGRTLKGRDMRRVRDAVWSQTGFDG